MQKGKSDLYLETIEEYIEHTRHPVAAERKKALKEMWYELLFKIIVNQIVDIVSF